MGPQVLSPGSSSPTPVVPRYFPGSVSPVRSAAPTPDGLPSHSDLAAGSSDLSALVNRLIPACRGLESIGPIEPQQGTSPVPQPRQTQAVHVPVEPVLVRPNSFP